MFKLEALEAKYGDSLLLHYGAGPFPKLILIDGGPGGVYKATLRKRLEQLRVESGREKLTLEMVMVSHIDRDHITGIISLTDELIRNSQNNQLVPYDIVRLWHNSFDDFIKNKEVEALSAAMGSAISASIGGAAFGGLGMDLNSVAVVADVAQGRTLRDNATLLSLFLNEPFEKIVLAPPVGKEVVDLKNGLTFTIIAPNKLRVENLEIAWNLALTKLKAAKDAEAAEAIAAAFLDKSVPNLSSIVVLAESEKKTMLLTGDARGDDILAGLNSAGLLKDGKIHVNLLKLPHHGSDRNVSTDFFRAVTADHYVISANGMYGNPDVPTLQMISEARGQDNFTIYLTNEETRLTAFFAEEKARGKNYTAVFRPPTELSITITL